ncbi:threonine aldolase family protein [Tuwongella immobilis]|uniref:Aromatic amino acid beta-eliminating lyase/threonine aldolase domain-containing protein n=1 Tax=Tuwongella immobilis TaxID=692036 RepID=A0A6C2YM59_9BACT|nr:GntG family PLP-dependent aldolase [Tuwongella immobilis]VIP02309.1 threonine aldolase : L-threonine aldolase OS=Isosphaera pallida (strain ATCC 43644 / DSM 9630 / IS1B) GN=Isop_3601 PE=4 SV=1: Beta_elim_lyase [Tuwongella immobilis]VTS01013.1 threonine aldolase : L-threonine aldolase OS=Isosphaera pallida (strain ATCC 43644 / DSM 9630 / IS1B) GN=Isop_3601 PE=4 SV=1: Beta_elim_lyase [Tuwongella immobilis]
MTPIDLRSDTVTRPTPEMRAIMAAAEVGDDVFGEDPTSIALQNRVATMFGKPAALWVPSGTMSNQIAIRCHTQPGDELLCETTSHVYLWEAGGPAVLSGVTCRTIDGHAGVLELEQLASKIRPDNEHYVRTKLVCLENTHNRGGGRVYPIEKIAAISHWARHNGLAMHLDGARIWNAIIASGISAAEWGPHFDSISVCFSKGLGAPAGSMLIGSPELIAQAKRVRKLFGGGMRQIGILAAAANYALDVHLPKLADDHRHAAILADAVRETPGLQLEFDTIETNLVWFTVDPEWGTAKDVAARYREHGLLIGSMGKQVLRACTHGDVSATEIERAAAIIRQHSAPRKLARA